MGDRGAQSYAYSGETTEWEDILMKKGVVTREQVFGAKGLDARDFPDPKLVAEQERAAEAAAQAAAEQKEHPLAKASLEEMEEAEDEFDDDAALARYREQRLQELRQKALRERFGEVVEISKADWVREVTEGSKASVSVDGEGEGQGTWVVVHLYQDRVEECRLLDRCLEAVARRFKAVKFLRIQATAAVENWPDRNLPTLFVYRAGELRTQLLGIKRLGGKGVTAADLEWYLAGQGVVETEMEEDPRAAGKARGTAALLGRGGGGGGGVRRGGYGDSGSDDDGDSD